MWVWEFNLSRMLFDIVIKHCVSVVDYCSHAAGLCNLYGSQWQCSPNCAPCNTGYSGINCNTSKLTFTHLGLSVHNTRPFELIGALKRISSAVSLELKTLTCCLGGGVALKFLSFHSRRNKSNRFHASVPLKTVNCSLYDLKCRPFYTVPICGHPCFYTGSIRFSPISCVDCTVSTRHWPYLPTACQPSCMLGLECIQCIYV